LGTGHMGTLENDPRRLKRTPKRTLGVELQ
jgi:hypothetical protein